MKTTKGSKIYIVCRRQGNALHILEVFSTEKKAWKYYNKFDHYMECYDIMEVVVQ